MKTWFVNVGHLTDSDLRFYGYSLLKENADFKYFRDTKGSDHVVDKLSPYLYVEDYNDAMAMRSSRIIANKVT